MVVGQGSECPAKIWWSADTNTGQALIELQIGRAGYVLEVSIDEESVKARIRNPHELKNSAFDLFRKLDIDRVREWRQESYERRNAHGTWVQDKG